jgi:hypothetical protein
MPVPTEPFQCVSTDILGPFKPSKATGNIYRLVFICYMTKYVELVPLQSIRATTIADSLWYADMEIQMFYIRTEVLLILQI